MAGLRRQDISSHDIDYVEYVGPGLIWGRILSTCVTSMWSNDIKYKYMFMFPQQNLARKELIITYNMIMASSGDLDQTDFTKDSPYLVLTEELWGIFFEYFREKSWCYKEVWLYVYVLNDTTINP